MCLLPVQAACKAPPRAGGLGGKNARRPGGHSPGCLAIGGQWAEFLQGQWPWAIVGSGAGALPACPAEHPHPTGLAPQEKAGLHLGQIAAPTANWNHLGDGDLGSSFCVLAPPLRSHLGSEASVTERGGDAGRKSYLGVQPVPHGLRRRRPPPGEAPPQTYLAAGAVAVGDWPSTHTADSPPVLSQAKSQRNKKVHTLLLPPPPQASCGPLPPLPLMSQGQRGGHTPSPEGGDEGCEERPAVSRSPQPARVLGPGLQASPEFCLGPVALATAVFRPERQRGPRHAENSHG